MATINTHDTDFYTWTQEQAALLRAGRVTDLDIAVFMVDAYEVARLKAAKETKLQKSTFPTDCPWLFEQIMDDDFWPE